ncbi:MsnO8 family LLM class oxidoreductase [Aerococcaceae bacterium DSM 111020]|nr:MsnO8 family LLM class oxidoreductase [Aerococcaceae bacterium DSM 111020]
MAKTELSLLNLMPRFKGESEMTAIERACELATFVEELGYQRYWVAEHHNFRGSVSAASDVIIQKILQETETIRIGAGGVMMPNHNPLQVAERYGTLDVLYPKRVDLGLGRAPGTDQQTAELLQQITPTTQNFESMIEQLQRYFSKESQHDDIIAHPGIDREVPLYILGSSLASAHTAAKFGLPYAFAGHIAPYYLEEALDIYRNHFIPSHQLKKPYVILSMTGSVYESQDEDQSSNEKKAAPISHYDGNYYRSLTSFEKLEIESQNGLKLEGSKSVAKEKWQQLKAAYQPDELMIVSYLDTLEFLKDNYRLIAEIIQD